MHARLSLFAPGCILAITGLSLMTACTFNDLSPSAATATSTDTEDHFHERSFSWTETNGPLAKSATVAGIASRVTNFESAEALKSAVAELEAKLEDRAFTDSLWKPLDYACDELEIALWNVYGTIRLDDSTVFDESILRSHCRSSEVIPVSGDTSAAGEALAKQAGWKWWNESEVTDRQYPYKMIGRSWDNFDLIIYKSTGGETQFEKRRTDWGVTAWWDTDATRIGIRIYLFDCGVEGGTKVCYYGTEWSDWDKNDDYVSKRDFAIGKITLNSNNVPVARPAKLRGSDAVLSMHSADHAGLQFGAYSSSGMPKEGAYGIVFSPEYVTW